MATVLISVIILNFFGHIFTQTGIAMLQSISTLGIISVDLTALGQYSQYLIYATIGCSTWLAAIILPFAIIETYSMARTYMRSGAVSRTYGLSSFFLR